MCHHLSQCHAQVEQVATPTQDQAVFGDLWLGDRFRFGAHLWTKLSVDTARKHSPASLALGILGVGFTGDVVCSFDWDDPVLFISPE